MDVPWPVLALCRQHPETTFYGLEDKSMTDAQVAEAKAICRVCPVRRECLEDALRVGEWGVWGGLTKAERDRCTDSDHDIEDAMAEYDANELEKRVVLRG